MHFFNIIFAEFKRYGIYFQKSDGGCKIHSRRLSYHFIVCFISGCLWAAGISYAPAVSRTVSLAIASSSLVGITMTVVALSAVVMAMSSPLFWFAS